MPWTVPKAILGIHISTVFEWYDKMLRCPTETATCSGVTLPPPLAFTREVRALQCDIGGLREVRYGVW